MLWSALACRAIVCYALFCSCDMRSDSPSPEQGKCPRGGYCDGLAFYPCPPGTYNPFNGSSSEASCHPCETGINRKKTSTI